MQKYGLTSAEALESRKKHGSNSITERAIEGFWDKFKHNLSDPMIKILCVALTINIFFAFFGQTEWYEPIGIALAVLIATFVSTFSEYKNENAFQRLQEQASQILCKVYRDGKIIELSINDIVTNDAILLQPGDMIPADGILLDGDLHVDQSMLNGETHEALKISAPKNRRKNDTIDFLNEYDIYRGSVVYSGEAIMLVTTVGDKSVYGQIASELQTTVERETPLKVKLSKLAANISQFGYIGGILIAFSILFQRIVVQNGFALAPIMQYCSDYMRIILDVIDALMLAVIIIVMAVPEGLPLMIAIVSALNMGKMLNDNVLVRKVSGIETAGSLNILFSDKTGTITKGKLEATVFIDGNCQEYKSFTSIKGELSKLLSLSIHKNTSAVISDNKPIGGNATDRALLSFSPAQRVNSTPVHNIPFSSANKYSATQIFGDYTLTLIKGAPEKVLEHCKTYYNEKGQAVPLNSLDEITAEIDKLASRAIRVLALATSPREIYNNQLPGGDWTLVGIIGIRDEIRPESIEAIAEVQSAGVQVVMITGDRKETAVSIAKEAGLITSDKDIIITSDELSDMNDEEIKSQLKDFRVIARALPSDKSRLVRLAQEMNLVVGMTGDGVNDSPALKAADVGFAMGSGTEVAKEASEIIILDDNFSSIDKAILYGRTLFNNVRKFIIFQLTINVAAVLISFISPLIGLKAPLTITQILWINLVMDTLAALAFGGEPALRRFMEEKPKRRDEHIVSSYMWSSILVGSLLCFGLSLFFLKSGYVQSFFREGNYILTGYFTFFIFSAIFNAFNARTERYNLLDNISQNKGFLKVLTLITLVQVALVYFGGAIFNCFGLTIHEWAFTILLALLIIPVDIIRKAFTHN